MVTKDDFKEVLYNIAINQLKLKNEKLKELKKMKDDGQDISELLKEVHNLDITDDNLLNTDNPPETSTQDDDQFHSGNTNVNSCPNSNSGTTHGTNSNTNVIK